MVAPVAAGGGAAALGAPAAGSDSCSASVKGPVAPKIWGIMHPGRWSQLGSPKKRGGEGCFLQEVEKCGFVSRWQHKRRTAVGNMVFCLGINHAHRDTARSIDGPLPRESTNKKRA